MTGISALGIVLITLALGLALPLVGVFVILRRQALLTDALAHVILLGIALAIVLKVDIVIGVFFMAVLAGLGIFFVKDKASLSLDAVVGVFFTTSLAVGSLLIPEEELLETFLGNLEKITPGDVVISLALGGLILASLLGRFREFAFVSFAPDLASVDKIKVRTYELLFILILALGVAMGIKLVGTLLISALVIVPAATAKIFSFGLKTMTLWSMLFGLAAVAGGLYAAAALAWPPGPAIVLVSAAIFFLTFFGRAALKTHR